MQAGDACIGYLWFRSSLAYMKGVQIVLSSDLSVPETVRYVADVTVLFTCSFQLGL